MKEQYQRFENVLRAKETYSMNCDECPIRTECYAFSESLAPGDNLNPEYSCEKLLFHYVMTGEKPQPRKER